MKYPHSKTVRATLLALSLLSFFAGAVMAQDAHMTFQAEALEWQPGPASLPAGAEMVLLEGNPGEAGPLTLRLRFPAGCTVRR